MYIAEKLRDAKYFVQDKWLYGVMGVGVVAAAAGLMINEANVRYNTTIVACVDEDGVDRGSGIALEDPMGAYRAFDFAHTWIQGDKGEDVDFSEASTLREIACDRGSEVELTVSAVALEGAIQDWTGANGQTIDINARTGEAEHIRL